MNALDMVPSFRIFSGRYNARFLKGPNSTVDPWGLYYQSTVTTTHFKATKECVHHITYNLLSTEPGNIRRSPTTPLTCTIPPQRKSSTISPLHIIITIQHPIPPLQR
ncbi:uncharacterized protein AKAW2_80227S [Aspergillus luchuensis]|uniref:Uncharacterized protein n=1 Tax=Aspergillus kawachii TaxID=1069201 RepID=A0A7R7WK04_ASPKA|nr:uncharacterized protein AKAW2_80227S [Aspergillus luchuensis]BCS04426.1 hypothetical protein AKAW2_80227S [Aspergillus luchuensis]